MDASFEVNDDLIIRRFSGDTNVDMIIASWEYIFQNMESLENIRGVITDLLDANLKMEMPQLEVLMGYLSKKEFFKRIKLAVLIDNRNVILPIIADKKSDELRIKPFATEEAAVSWILS